MEEEITNLKKFHLAFYINISVGKVTFNNTLKLENLNLKNNRKKDIKIERKLKIVKDESTLYFGEQKKQMEKNH